MYIPFTRPDITDADIAAAAAVWRSGLLTGGEVTRLFAASLRRESGAQAAVCCSSATAGLIATLLFFGVGQGDEVVVPAYTFTATAAAVRAVGAEPVFADCPRGRFHIDGESVARVLTCRTTAVICVDFGGVLCDRAAIREVCGDIPLIADAAHAMGAAGVADNCDLAVLSFHAAKNLTTGEGGAILINTPDSAFAERRLSEILLHGLDRQSAIKTTEADYDVLFAGTKGNLPDVLAAVGLSQLSRCPDMLRRRREIISRYMKALPKGWGALSHGDASAAHLFAAVLPKDLDRDEVFCRLRERGICCSVHFRPLPMTSAWRGCRGEFDNAAALWRRELSLPLSSVMDDTAVDFVCGALGEFS